MANIEILSAISIPLQMYRGDSFLGPATGFFYKVDNRAFLISNWHVFSGRNSYTGQPLHRSLATPDKFKLMIHSNDLGIYRNGDTLQIQTDDENPIWKQHQKGQEYDIAFIEVPITDSYKYYTIQDIMNVKLAISVATEVHIIGFPRGIAAQGIWPIWKRGTIAAEPYIDRIDGLPIYLVDSASREGMSGSPVYIHNASGVGRLENTSGISSFGQPITRFIGVYSGRYGDESDMQLGRVWKAELIDEMINNPAPGSYRITK